MLGKSPEVDKVGVGLPVRGKKSEINEVDGAAIVEVGAAAIAAGIQPVLGNDLQILPVDVVIFDKVAFNDRNSRRFAGDDKYQYYQR
jgi:hypothetical protein